MWDIIKRSDIHVIEILEGSGRENGVELRF